MFWQVILAVAATAPSANGTDDVYRRVVSRALEQAQTQVASGLEFDIDHSDWNDPWVIRTAHYEVRATRSYLQTARIARDLEFMYGEFVKVLGKGTPPTELFPVWVFPTIGDYNDFNGSHGLHSSLYGSFYAVQDPARPVVTYQDRNTTLLGMWLTHGAAHQFLDRVFGPQRTVWIDEGLASYFSLYWDWSFGAREFQRIAGGRSFVPLRRLLSDSLEAYANAADDRFIELGMLFHFLLNSCEATANGTTGDPGTGPFQEFLRASVRGQETGNMEFVQNLRDASGLLEEDFRNFEFEQ